MEKDFGFMTERDWSDVAARFRLNPRESELLRQMLAGRTAHELQRRLKVSADALHKNLIQLYRKVGARDRVDLALRVTHGIARQQPRQRVTYETADEDDLSA